NLATRPERSRRVGSDLMLENHERGLLRPLPLVALLLSACGTPQERAAERALRTGNAHYRADRFAPADSAYSTAPEDVRATSNRGNALYRLGAWKDAAARFQEALSLDSAGAHRAHAAHNLGNAL